MDTVEFLPVEVVKPFMSLTVGDILRVNMNTGRYELRSESEDIGDNTYAHEKYEISLEPWLIEKYFDHFQIYEYDKLIEKPKEILEVEHPMTPKEALERGYTPEQEALFATSHGDFKEESEAVNIAELKQELDELKEMFGEVLKSLGDG